MPYRSGGQRWPLDTTTQRFLSSDFSQPRSGGAQRPFDGGPWTPYDEVCNEDSPIAIYKHGEPSGTLLAARVGPEGTYTATKVTHGTTGLVAQNGADPAATFLRDAGLDTGGAATVPQAAAEAVFDAATTYSYETWIKPASVSFTTNANVLSRWLHGLYLDTSGHPAIFYGAAGGTSAVATNPLVAGNLYHVVHTFDGTTHTVYVNAVSVISVVGTSAVSGPLGFGVYPGAAGYFDGVMDETRVYATALPQARVQAHYDAGTGGAVTPISGSDSATGTDAGTVSATVPGSDTSSGTDTGTVSATVPGSDSGAGTDVQTSLVVPTAGSDSASGSDAGTVSATVPGTESSSGSDAGTVAATVPGSDSSTGTEAGSASVTASSSDSSTGTDTGAASVTASSTDAATGTESHTVGEIGAGGEGGAGFELDVVSVTAAGADSGTGTDSGVVQDLAATPIVGDDSGTGTEDGSIVVTGVVTPPAPEPGGGGIIDESAIYGEFRALSSHDGGMALDLGVVERSEPQRRLTRVKLPRRPAPAAAPAPAPVFRALGDVDGAVGHDEAAMAAMVGAIDSARGREADDFQVVYDESEADDLEILRLMGVL